MCVLLGGSCRRLLHAYGGRTGRGGTGGRAPDTNEGKKGRNKLTKISERESFLRDAHKALRETLQLG